MEITKEIAYLLGVYLGDGCLYHRQFTVVKNDEDTIQRVASILESIFGRKPRTYTVQPNRTTLYACRIEGKEVPKWFRMVCPTKNRLPACVLNAPDEVQKEFIAGLMDTDGYISYGMNKEGFQKVSMGFTSASPWLLDFRAMFQRHGVKVGKLTLKNKYRSPLERDCFQVGINVRSFADAGLYFRCVRKQSRLNRYKTSVRFQAY
jgi:intein/homing endonuclease